MTIEPNEVDIFVCIALKSALRLYQRTGIKANRAYTPKNMLATASRLTGQTFKRGQYSEAITALEELIGKRG